MTALQLRLDRAVKEAFGNGAVAFVGDNSPGVVKVVVRRPDGAMSDRVFMTESAKLMAMADGELQLWLNGLFIAGGHP